MHRKVLFQMWQPYRQKLIADHKFYVEQANNRLLGQFEDISDEADKVADDWLLKHSLLFDPDRHDESEFYERANDEKIRFYELLSNMHLQIRLSVIAGMFHEWDKQLRDWIATELAHTFLGHETKAAIWKGNFQDIVNLLECFNWSVRSRPYFARLDACRLVVNVFKHGLGDSFVDLKDNHPCFLADVFGDRLSEDAR